MDVGYQIFKDRPEGPIWIENVASLSKITERLTKLNETAPGQYFVYDVRQARIITELSCEQAHGQNQIGAIGMGNTYDLFKKNENGDPIWVETVAGLRGLQKRLMKLSSLKPGTYLVYDPTEKQFIEPFKKAAS